MILQEDEARLTTAPASLEGEIDTLLALDEFRDRARGYRDQLATTLTKRVREYWERKQARARVFKVRDSRGRWDAPGDLVECALVGNALRIGNRCRPGSDDKHFTRTLFEQEFSRITLRSLFQRSSLPQSPRDDSVPLLRAARALHYLVRTPGRLFSRAALCCYYRIVYEFYASAYPDWTTGGASASDDAPSTAFITNECVRAILTLKGTLIRTARVVSCLERLADEFAISDVKDEWRDLRQRRMRSVALATFMDIVADDRIIFELPSTQGIQNQDDIVRWLKRLPNQIRRELDTFAAAAALAQAEVLSQEQEFKRRANGGATGRNTRSNRSAAKATMASRTRVYSEDAWFQVGRVISRIEGTLSRAQEFAASTQGPFDSDWKGLQHLLTEAAERIDTLLRPTRRYLAGLLDRELSAGEGANARGADIPELVCAAVGWGSLTEQWDDPRLTLAAEYATKDLSHRGEFPQGRPFQTGPKGYMLHTANLEVGRAYCRLIQYTGYPVAPGTVRRLLARFEGLKRPVDREMIGLTAEGSGYPERTSWWTTALGVQSADRLVRMLDAHINRRIERNFTSERPAKPRLEGMLVSDLGLAASWPRASERGSVLESLHRLQAHAVGLPATQLPQRRWKTDGHVWSLILHGPPGTGKTTLTKALAASAQKLLITITPSDIIVKGSEEAEARARLVFKALSLLTDAVILFDEFDEILKSRERPSSDQRTVFEFLTPGMLPKLADLYTRASTQRICYVLATNRIKKMDDAAIRKKRFDCKVGVYPLDAISRIAGFLHAAERYEWIHRRAKTARSRRKRRARTRGSIVWTPERLVRLQEAVRSTAFAPVSDLAMPGWCLLESDKELPEATPLDVLLRPRQSFRAKRIRWPESEMTAVVEWSKEAIIEECKDKGLDRAGCKKPSTPRMRELNDMMKLYALEEWILECAPEDLPRGVAAKLENKKRHQGRSG